MGREGGRQIGTAIQTGTGHVAQGWIGQIRGTSTQRLFNDLITIAEFTAQNARPALVFAVAGARKAILNGDPAPAVEVAIDHDPLRVGSVRGAGGQAGKEREDGGRLQQRALVHLVASLISMRG